MANIAENTIGQNSTTSNQGVNKMPKLDAKSHFFLEDETFTQSSSNAFGVISDNQFRTTSLVNVTNKKVVSICSGQIFIQPVTGDSSKVNLILKPYRQPVNGLAIKYFIYRGLSKDQFLDTSDKVLSTGSGLITYINNEFNNFYNQDSSLSPIPVFLGKFIGYPDSAALPGETQELEDLIDFYYYKISQTFDDETGDITNPKIAFELPMIPAGTHLATATGLIGLDIVLNNGDYYIENDPNLFKLDLAFARAPFNIIDVSSITDEYQKKLLREAITLFVDPAAYYGLHANGGKIFKFGITQAIETPANIYTLITSFDTKNTIYIYVQSNRQRSYNFYNKYVLNDTNPNNMKIGIDEINLLETTYETNFWPLKTFTTAPVSGSTQQTIALQFTTDKNANTSLYGNTANIFSPNNENFVDIKNLIQEPDANGVISDFTKTVVLKSPIANNVNIASIVQLIYLGKNTILSKPGIDDGDPATPPQDPIYFTTKYMDDVFDLVNASSFLQADKIYHVHSYKPTLYSQKEIDKKRGKVVSYTQRTQNTISISETEGITLFTYLAIVENEESEHYSTAPNLSSNKEATGYRVQDITGLHSLPNLPSNEYVTLKTFSENVNIITGLTLRTNDGSVASTMALGITELQNNVLKGIINNSKNVKLYFEPFLNGNNNIVSAENYKYQKFRLGVIFDDDIDLKQIISMPSVLDEIIIYNSDNLIFFSKEYSNNIKEYGIINDLLLDVRL